MRAKGRRKTQRRRRREWGFDSPEKLAWPEKDIPPPNTQTAPPLPAVLLTKRAAPARWMEKGEGEALSLRMAPPLADVAAALRTKVAVDDGRAVRLEERRISAPPLDLAVLSAAGDGPSATQSARRADSDQGNGVVCAHREGILQEERVVLYKGRESKRRKGIAKRRGILLFRRSS